MVADGGGYGGNILPVTGLEHLRRRPERLARPEAQDSIRCEAKYEIRNYEKHEARNSKYETNLNDKNPKFKTFCSFGHLNFDIVSDFDPATLGLDRYPPLAGRISDLLKI